MTETARHFPQMPPELPGESAGAYTDRLTGADQSGRIPYDHPRNRQCSIGYHGECSDPAGEACKCPCHTAEGKLDLRVDDLEELVVATYGLITDCARRSVVLAQAEARTLGHGAGGTGHLLIGLGAEEGGIASLCLADLGLDLDAARDRLQAVTPLARRGVPPDIPFTHGLRKAMENALRESILMGHSYIGTAHLLLALLREAEGPSDHLLIAAGITPLVVREEVMRRLCSYEEPRVSPAGAILEAPSPTPGQRRAATASLPPHPWTFRVGRTLGTTLYIQMPGDDRKRDIYVGLMDTPELAEWAARALSNVERI